MDRNQRRMPVILLMDKNSSNERITVREWFENSRFSTCEASNVFEVLEEISDFTMQQRPDVVLLDVDSCDVDFQLVRDMIETSAGVDDLSIMALSSQVPKPSNGSCFQGNLGQVATRLDKLFPSSGDDSKQPAAA